MTRLRDLHQHHSRPDAGGARVAQFARIARRTAEPISDPKVAAMLRAKAAGAPSPLRVPQHPPRPGSPTE